MTGNSEISMRAAAATEGLATSFARTLTTVPPRDIARILVALVTALLVLGFVANVVIYNIAPDPEHVSAKLMKRFDLGHEPSLPNWYSSLALLASAILLATISRLEKIHDSKQTAAWAVLALAFVVLATDEAILIHEMADAPMQQWLDTSGPLLLAWVIPYSLITVCAGVLYIPFLRSLERTTRNLFLTAGAMFVTGAIGIELIEGAIIDALGVQAGFESLRLTIVQTIAEAFEMYAIVVFIYALLRHLQSYSAAPPTTGR